MANNYETMKLQMRDEFLKYDQAAMIEKFGLGSDDENIYITFFGTEYAVDRNTGDVRSEHGEAGYNEAMTIYDVLCYSKPHCKASGRMVNMGSLSTIQGGSMKRTRHFRRPARSWAACPRARVTWRIASPCSPSSMSCSNTGIPTTSSRRPFSYSWMPE